MNLDGCLPEHLRGPTTTITKIAAGLSGAGVYRVDAAGRAFVLKIADAREPIERWRTRLDIQRLASAAGLAPEVVHADDAQRAVVSAFVADRSFPAYYMDPRSRDAALALLGGTLRRLHDLALPAGAEARDPLELLAGVHGGLAGFAVPAFVGDAIARVRAETPPPRDRADVLSHNDVNPTNLVFDGEHLMLLDWDVAGPNDPYYDLAAIAVFLRMDEPSCLRLLGAHDGAPVTALPPRFAYCRRLIAVLCGALFVQLARASGHAGGSATLDATASLGEVVQRMRAGALSPATPDGKWAFGLGLIKDSVAL